MNELEAARRAAVLVASAHVGGCPACAQSVAALSAPRYAQRLRERGVILMAAPRQADVLLLCGTLNERSRGAAMALVEETPRPRALVAVGDCALNGCVFAGSPALTSQSLAAALNVNVEISGCPPSPEAILDAISEAQRLLAGEEPDEDAAEVSGADSTDGDGSDGGDGGDELEDEDGAAETSGERGERR
jgi:Ni,Fe-hydrogenase III small subunit